MQLEDAETGGQYLLDTSSAAVRRAYAERAKIRRESLRRLARSSQVDLIEVATDGRHLEALLLVADTKLTYLVSGNGDVIEPDEGVAAIGSGGPFATAAFGFSGIEMSNSSIPAGCRPFF